MSISIPPATNTEDFSGNIIRPFQLEKSVLRGRIVSFNTVLDDILIPHDYPPVVSDLVAQVVTLCALLSSMLKFDGIFTLQTSGDGPVSMLVADMTSTGEIRGCANFDEARLKTLGDNPDFCTLVGQGYIAFTVDQGKNTERYQGIVELKEGSIIESIEHYFSQSEQVQTNIALAVDKKVVDNKENQYFARGLILQEMPEEGGHATAGKQEPDNVISLKSENWSRAAILMDSCKREELLDRDLNAHDILWRLFHEEGVRVFSPMALKHQCRCSEDRVKNIYKMLSEEDRNDIKKDGRIEMVCDFCSKNYSFTPEEVDE
jgi:molecular chaperone Hsp33